MYNNIINIAYNKLNIIIFKWTNIEFFVNKFHYYSVWIFVVRVKRGN